MATSPVSPQCPEPYLLKDLSSAILAQNVFELELLKVLRKKGWDEEGLDGHFNRQRQIADSADDRMNSIWFNRMKKVFRELDVQARFVPTFGRLEFLDLGCCPGGFTSYILQKHHRAHGTGISLPVEQGGHPMALEQHLSSRFELHLADLLYYKLHSGHRPLLLTSMQPLPDGFAARFDIVILDGHFLRTYRSPALTDPDEWDRHRLLISQIVIALRSVRPGGTIVIKLSHPEKLLTAQILHMLDNLSKALCVHKPHSLHANRGTFYAIAKGIGRGPHGEKQSQYLQGLEDLWHDITFGGETGRGRFMTATDLDFIATYDDIVTTYLGRLIDLGRSVWLTQADALQVWFSKRGIL